MTVLAGANLVVPGLPVSAVLRRWGDVGALVTMIRAGGSDRVVLVSDGLHADTEAAVAAAIRAAGAEVVEVRSLRWDGETPSPVSAACRGVISGFGLAGVPVAVHALLGDPGPS